MAAAAADLVILALPAHALCAPVHRWLWDWSHLRQKGKVGALVVCCDLIADELEETHEMREQLSRVAQDAQLEAFYWVMDSKQPIEPLLPAHAYEAPEKETVPEQADHALSAPAHALC